MRMGPSKARMFSMGAYIDITRRQNPGAPPLSSSAPLTYVRLCSLTELCRSRQLSCSETSLAVFPNLLIGQRIRRSSAPGKNQGKNRGGADLWGLDSTPKRDRDWGATKAQMQESWNELVEPAAHTDGVGQSKSDAFGAFEGPIDLAFVNLIRAPATTLWTVRVAVAFGLVEGDP